MTSTSASPLAPERVLGLGVLIVLLGACLIVLKPFISALLWAIVLTFSLWPLNQHLVHFLGGRRGLASGIIVVAMAVLVLLPFVIVGATLADNVQELKVVVRRWIDEGPPSPPEWLERIPLIGHSAVAQWQTLSADSSSFLTKAKRFIEPASLWVLKSGLALGRGLLELALSILVSFLFLRNGQWLGKRLDVVIGRIAGSRGHHLLTLAGKTIRSVVYGVIGTALIQAVVAGIGFLIAGVPGAPLLALITFFLCLLPALGAPLVWVPAAFWLFHQGASGRAVFLIIWGLLVSGLDNFVKPWLISQGSKLPFLLVFFGALGGVLAFGFIGLFIGPTLLAVGYKLFEEWLASKPVKPTPRSVQMTGLPAVRL